jgi:carbon storage regulator
MLVLTRKAGEKIRIGENVTLTVLETAGNRIRIGIDAPAEVCILRGELACWLDLDATAEPAPDAVVEESPRWGRERAIPARAEG